MNKWDERDEMFLKEQRMFFNSEPYGDWLFQRLAAFMAKNDDFPHTPLFEFQDKNLIYLERILNHITWDEILDFLDKQWSFSEKIKKLPPSERKERSLALLEATNQSFWNYLNDPRISDNFKPVANKKDIDSYYFLKICFSLRFAFGVSWAALETNEISSLENRLSKESFGTTYSHAYYSGYYGDEYEHHIKQRNDEVFEIFTQFMQNKSLLKRHYPLIYLEIFAACYTGILSLGLHYVTYSMLGLWQSTLVEIAKIQPEIAIHLQGATYFMRQQYELSIKQTNKGKMPRSYKPVENFIEKLVKDNLDTLGKAKGKRGGSKLWTTFKKRLEQTKGVTNVKKQPDGVEYFVGTSRYSIKRSTFTKKISQIKSKLENNLT